MRIGVRGDVLYVGAGPGRGAWSCPGCVATVTVGAIARALRHAVSERDVEMVRREFVRGKTEIGIVRD